MSHVGWTHICQAQGPQTASTSFYVAWESLQRIQFKNSVHKLHVPQCILMLLSAHWRHGAARHQYTVNSISKSCSRFQQWHSRWVSVPRNVNGSSLGKCQRTEELMQKEGNLMRDRKANTCLCKMETRRYLICNEAVSKEYKLWRHFGTRHGARYANLSIKKSKN